MGRAKMKADRPAKPKQAAAPQPLPATVRAEISSMEVPF